MQFVCLWGLNAFSWAFASCPSSLSTTGMNDPSIRYDKGFLSSGALEAHRGYPQSASWDSRKTP